MRPTSGLISNKRNDWCAGLDLVAAIKLSR